MKGIIGFVNGVVLTASISLLAFDVLLLCAIESKVKPEVNEKANSKPSNE